MASDRTDGDALRFMILGILQEILSLADRPSQLGEYLTLTIRELVGGRLVVMALCDSEDETSKVSILSVCPKRLGSAFSADSIERVCFCARVNNQPVLLIPGDPGVPEELDCPAMVLPLSIGTTIAGFLIIFDLLDANNVVKVLQELNQISPVTALVLRNARHFGQMEDRLRQAEKMEAIGQLAGGVAHDFNNQLSGILGYADMILNDSSASPVILNYARSIVQGAERSAQLTRQLLAFARKGNYQNVPVDLHALIAETVTLLGRTVNKSIAINAKLCAKRTVIIGDPAQLQNVLLNLGINARDALSDGGSIVFATENVVVAPEPVGSAVDLVPGCYCSIAIRDTGMGMSKEVLSHLFEPFFTTKAPGKGTGLGLAAAYGVVKSHRGRITAYSEPGRGTEFRIMLPLAESDCTVPGNVPMPQHEQIPSLRVLVVDDEAIVRELVGSFLESLDSIPTLCSSGAEALDILGQTSDAFDLVVLDMVMPEMDGPALFARIRTLYPSIRVVIASGYSIDGRVQGLLDTGNAWFIQKPFRKADFVHVVKSALGAA